MLSTSTSPGSHTALFEPKSSARVRLYGSGSSPTTGALTFLTA